MKVRNTEGYNYKTPKVKVKDNNLKKAWYDTVNYMVRGRVMKKDTNTETADANRGL